MNAPVIFVWNGDTMEPLARFLPLCNKQFVVHEQYRMEAVEERSRVSHNHFFASLHESWLNLPEHFTAEFPTETHLRKYALIKAGYADKRSIVCASKAEAVRFAAFVKPLDEYAIVVASEAVVTVYTAQSQSEKAMGKKIFQESKTAVLDIVSAMIEVKPAELAKHTDKQSWDRQ